MKILAILSLIIVVAMFAKDFFFGFRSQTPADYAGTGPQFILKQHLNGRILSEGLVYGPNGKMTNSFVAELFGEWDGDSGTLSENFTYSNGKTQARKWTLKIGENNTFTATADDIVGAGHGVKQVWLLNDHVFILEFHFHTQMQGALGGSNIANRHCITHFALSLFYGETR